MTLPTTAPVLTTLPPSLPTVPVPGGAGVPDGGLTPSQKRERVGESFPSKRARKPARDRGVQITEKDVRLLRWLCRYTATTQETLRSTVYNGLHFSTIYEQLARLVKVGLLEDIRTGPSNLCRPHRVHALYVPTREGYALAGTGLGHKTVSLATVMHTLAVAEVGLGLEATGYKVVTDREISQEIAWWRADGGGEVDPTAVWLQVKSDDPSVKVGKHGHLRAGRLHAPDLVVDVDGALYAFEVELTNKPERELLRILSTYGTTRKYASVIYYVPNRQVQAKIERALEKLHWDEKPNVEMVGMETPLNGKPTIEFRTYTPGHSPSKVKKV